MSRKDRKAKPHFRIQGLELRVLMSATWMDSTELTSDATSPSLHDLTETASHTAASELPPERASTNL